VQKEMSKRDGGAAKGGPPKKQRFGGDAGSDDEWDAEAEMDGEVAREAPCWLMTPPIRAPQRRQPCVLGRENTLDPSLLTDPSAVR